MVVPGWTIYAALILPSAAELSIPILLAPPGGLAKEHLQSSAICEVEGLDTNSNVLNDGAAVNSDNFIDSGLADDDKESPP